MNRRAFIKSIFAVGALSLIKLPSLEITSTPKIDSRDFILGRGVLFVKELDGPWKGAGSCSTLTVTPCTA